MSETDELFGALTGEDGGLDFDVLFSDDSTDPHVRAVRVGRNEPQSVGR